MLHLHHANRTERLADVLLARLGAPAPGRSPFDPDVVVVPSAGVQRWLALRIADRFGICAQVSFDFLATWLWRRIGEQVAGVGDTSPFAAERLAWRVHAALADPALVGEHPRLARYLARADAAGRLELAQRVAQALERTVTYRPDWLARWSDGASALPRADAGAREDEAWQRALWRRVCAELGLDGRHPAEAWVARLAAAGGAGLPAELHAFALPTVAPLHALLLQQVARWSQVHVYVLDPCRAYWSDLVDRKRAARLADEGRLDAHEVGHPLLASWGRQTQTLVDTWQRLPDAAAAVGTPVSGDDDAAPEDDGTAVAAATLGAAARDAAEVAPVVHEWFEPAGGGALLQRLQDSLLDLAPPQPGDWPMADGDHSVEVHLCHSLTRQVEVLHDRLLSLFAADPSLRPCDVLVATPRLDMLAPIVDAVFGTAPPALALPCTVTGLARSRENPVARALLDLASLLASRAPGSALLAWLAQPVVAARAGLDADDLESLQRWLGDAGLHWGWDAAHRAALGLPPGAAHTAHDAIDRLLLGHALPRDAALDAWRASDPSLDPPGPGFLPVDGAEGLAARALGRFAAVVERLRAWHADWARPAPPADWGRRWRTALADTVDATALPDGDEALRETLAAVADLVAAMAEGGGDTPLALGAVSGALAAALDATSPGAVPGGAITVASMNGLRSLPFAVVCLVGLDDGVFPARDATAEFDLMARAPRRGDRQRRHDERNVFLDAILCARRHLLVTCTGRSVRDNAPLPPSVVVSDLLDLLVPAVATDASDPASLAAARRRLVVEHPLQPFSPAVFGGDPQADPRVRSHRDDAARSLREGLAAARAAAGGAAPSQAPPTPAGGDDTPDEPVADDAPDDAEADVPVAGTAFFVGPLAPTPPVDGVATEAATSLAELQRFWRHPCRTLLQQRLRLALEVDDDAIDDDEPLVADGRIARRWADRWLPVLVAAGDTAHLPAEADARAWSRLVQADTGWPHGSLARPALDRRWRELRTLADRILRLRGDAPRPHHAATVTLQVDGREHRLDGTFGGEGELLGPPWHGLLRWRGGPFRGADLFGLWIEHLLLCASPPAAWTEAGHRPRSVLVAADRAWVLSPVDEPRPLLASLLAWRAEGLRRPLPFFPRTSWALACRERGGLLQPPAGPSQAAAAWRGQPNGGAGESADPWVRQAFRDGADPVAGALAAEACTLAEALLAPLRAQAAVLPEPAPADPAGSTAADADPQAATR